MPHENTPTQKEIQLINADCLEAVKLLPHHSVDSIVTDPPYELGFMGKAWDASGVAYSVELWREALRVLKPGGHLLAFGGSRTYHRLACAVEDAGFEIRDQIMWIYGSGFPKSHNLDGDWDGWGTALKPAHEPIVVARKPFKGTVAENVLTHSTGALNIDGCRVEGQAQPFGNPTAAEGYRLHKRAEDWQPNNAGRWPANVIHDGSEEVLAAFPIAPGQSGAVTGNEPGKKTQNCYGEYNGQRNVAIPRGDSGTAARFFYCAKASRADRGEGNIHPTVKPTELMRYLCRLVTPPGGTVLDPFLGSGSTGKAARAEGFRFIGIEREAEYYAIARKRIGAGGGRAVGQENSKQPERQPEPEREPTLFTLL